MIFLIAPVVSNNLQPTRTIIYRNTTQMIANDPDDWDDRDHLDRTEFYLDDWDGCVKFKVMI